MCELDFVVRKHKVEKPYTAHKVFSRLTEKWAYFWSVIGRVPRGKWVRWDSKEVQSLGSPCLTHEDGFHCFVRPMKNREKEIGLNADVPLSTIPVQVKGDVTIANQFGDEILIGEWLYVPTVEELEREEAEYQLQAA